jgi:hypothetical protein
MNLGTAPTRQVSVVQPLQVIETPVEGVNVHDIPPSDNKYGTVGLH